MTSPAVALPRVSEKKEQAAIVKLLCSLGATVYVIGTVRAKGDHPGTRQTPGIPDIFAWIGRDGCTWPLWIEVKARGGRLRPAQAEFKMLADHAQNYHIVGGCDDVIAWLQDHGWLK